MPLTRYEELLYEDTFSTFDEADVGLYNFLKDFPDDIWEKDWDIEGKPGMFFAHAKVRRIVPDAQDML